MQKLGFWGISSDLGFFQVCSFLFGHVIRDHLERCGSKTGGRRKEHSLWGPVKNFYCFKKSYLFSNRLDELSLCSSFFKKVLKKFFFLFCPLAPFFFLAVCILHMKRYRLDFFPQKIIRKGLFSSCERFSFFCFKISFHSKRGNKIKISDNNILFLRCNKVNWKFTILLSIRENFWWKFEFFFCKSILKLSFQILFMQIKHIDYGNRFFSHNFDLYWFHSLSEDNQKIKICYHNEFIF